MPGHRGTRAVQRMVEFAPATGGLALWVQHRDVDRPLAGGPARGAAAPAPAFSPDAAPHLATDGHTVFYPPAFERLALPEQTGRVAHAVLHIALRHAQRMAELQQRLGEVDRQLFNLCANAIVDTALAHLSWLRLPARAVFLDQLLEAALGLPTSAEAALLEWDVERLYRAIDDRRPAGARSNQERETGDQSQAGGQGQRSSAAGRGLAEAPEPSAGAAAPALEDGPRARRARALAGPEASDLLPDAAGADPRAHDPDSPESEAEQTRSWGERLLRAHASDGEHSILRVLLADLPRTRTPWEQALRSRLARALGVRPGLSWSRPSRSYIANQGRAGPGRRLPWEPGHSAARRVPRLVLVVDVSGSIADALLARFAREIEAIARRQEAALVLVIGDDRVQQVVQLEAGQAAAAALRAIEFRGGGGTDFTPLLQEADRHRPDIGVVLTDLDGPARFEPRWPLIWAVPETHAGMPVPFGRRLVID